MATAFRKRAQRLRNAVEPVAAGVYFAPEAHTAYEALGFEGSPLPSKDGIARPELKSYFTSRGACIVDAKRNPEAAEVPGVAILRVESALFFANADAVRDHIRAYAADGHVKAVVIDAETVPAIDVTAGHMLMELGHDLRAQGKRLVLAREIGQVRDAIDHTGSGSAPPEIETYPTVRAAVAALRLTAR